MAPPGQIRNLNETHQMENNQVNDKMDLDVVVANKSRPKSLPRMELFVHEFVAVEPDVKPTKQDAYYEMFCNSALEKQVMDPKIVSSLKFAPSPESATNNLSSGPTTNFNMRDGNLFQKLSFNNRQGQDQQVDISSKERKSIEELLVEDQFIKFLATQELSQEQRQLRWQLIVDLFFILRDRYPDCELYVFGSFLTGLGDSQSAVDISVDLQPNNNNNNRGDFDDTWEEEELILKSRIKSLPKRGQVSVAKYLNEVNCRHNEKEKMFVKCEESMGFQGPSIHLTHSRTGISINLFFGCWISVHTSRLLKFYIDFDPRVKPFYQFIRYWASFHQLSGSLTKINNYSLYMLALVYLTEKKIVPTVNLLQILSAAQRMREMSENPDEVQGWDVSFCMDRDIIDTCFVTATLPYDYKDQRVALQMALDFFKMFQEVDFSQKFVCPLVGKLFDRETLYWLETITTTEEVHLPQRLKKWRLGFGDIVNFCVKTHFWKPLALQDPFNLDYNLGEAVEQKDLEFFQMACQKTAEILESNPDSILQFFQKLDFY